MKRDEIIATLKRSETDLRKRGITHAAVFGSVARGEERPDSDIDILIDIDPVVADDMSVYDYVGLKRFVASLFNGAVDVVDREALKPRIRPNAVADSIYAF